MPDNLKCYIKRHGDFQIEFKIRYPVKKERSRYNFEFYIFSPQVLAVDRTGYGIKSFLKDIKLMTRLSTPDISLGGLIRPECSESPLNRIKLQLDRIVSGMEPDENKVIYELRTCANIIRVQMRKNRYFLKKKIEKGEDSELMGKWLLDFIDKIEKFLLKYRSLKKVFLNPDISEKMYSAFCWADESISLNIQREMSIICIIFDISPKRTDYRNRIMMMLKNELEYRKKQKYESINEKEKKRDNTADGIIYRENILKKWSQSALYLTKNRSTKPFNAGQIIAGAAAAAAMSFAVIATLLTNKFFSESTYIWALAVVIAYILKDRIKEILKSGFRIMFPKVIPDRMNILIDPSVKKRIGHSKSYVGFSTSDDISRKIRIARGWEKKTFKDLLPPENVIIYRHEILLNGKEIYNHHQRLDAVDEIIRFELSRFLQLMDNPNQVYYSVDNDKVKKKKQRRTYHLNLITLMKNEKTQDERLIHHRIILNRNGIIRLEKTNEEG